MTFFAVFLVALDCSDEIDLIATLAVESSAQEWSRKVPTIC